MQNYSSKIKIKEMSIPRPKAVLFPIIFGMGVATYLFMKEFDSMAFAFFEFTSQTLFWLFMAVVIILSRDLAGMFRLRVLSENQLSWMQTFYIRMLCEFTATVTPSMMGGSSLEIIFLIKEGIKPGKSSAIVLTTLLCDELFFVLLIPIFLIIYPFKEIFLYQDTIPTTIIALFFLAYGIKFVWTLILIYGIFIKPRQLFRLFYLIFKLPFLRRWRYAANRAGYEFIISSAEIKKMNFKFCFYTGITSIWMWTARYIVLILIFAAFFKVSEPLLIFCRQVFMWVFMMLTPTPGGSGFNELGFDRYLGEFVPIAGLTMTIGILWRLITFYMYLFIGVIITPRWINGKFLKHKHTDE